VVHTFGDMGLPKQWTMEISSVVKSLVPHKSIVDGTRGVNQTNLPIDTSTSTLVTAAVLSATRNCKLTSPLLLLPIIMSTT
jgi:hypothetical protein